MTNCSRRPERSDQANLSPQAAANLWRQYIQPLKSRVGEIEENIPFIVTDAFFYIISIPI